MAPESELVRTDRTRLRRHAERGSFDRAEANAILDEAYIAHVGFVSDGTPRVLPMTYGRIGDLLYLHGAAGNAMLRAAHAAEICVTVTLLDGLVLARSAFHHSMNFRCVVLVGEAAKVDSPEEKAVALAAIVDHVLPGRSSEARPSSAAEIRATTVLRLPIAEGSVKVRAGDALDEPDDVGLDVWAGVVPLRLDAGSPVANGDLLPGVAAPAPDAARLRRSASG